MEMYGEDAASLSQGQHRVKRSFAVRCPSCAPNTRPVILELSHMLPCFALSFLTEFLPQAAGSGSAGSSVADDL